MQYTVELPWVTPTGNATTLWHWSKRVKEKKKWFVMMQAKMRHIPKAAQGEVRHVHIVRFGPRTLDDENLRWGAKYILMDNLRPPKITRGVYKSGKRKGQKWIKNQLGLSLIWDDDPLHCMVTWEQVKCPSNQAKTIITITTA